MTITAGLREQRQDTSSGVWGSFRSMTRAALGIGSVARSGLYLPRERQKGNQ